MTNHSNRPDQPWSRETLERMIESLQKNRARPIAPRKRHFIVHPDLYDWACEELPKAEAAMLEMLFGRDEPGGLGGEQ